MLQRCLGSFEDVIKSAPAQVFLKFAPREESTAKGARKFVLLYTKCDNYEGQDTTVISESALVGHVHAIQYCHTYESRPHML